MVWRLVKLIFLAAVLVGLLFGGGYLYRYLQSDVFTAKATDVGLGEPFSIKLSGTGSMYPTFPKGTGKTVRELSNETVGSALMYAYPSGIRIFNRFYYQYQLQRGDIISFENAKTKQITSDQSGEEREFLKRVFALSGDTVEFRDGVAYLNNQPQLEPYTALARSTFGGEFLNDCKKLTVPSGSLFVMGDNRKISADSRSELGLVAYSDVDAVIPWDKQKGVYDKHFRNVSQDLNESQKIKIDKPALLKQINTLRSESDLKPLVFNSKLEKAAAKRGDVILKYDDLSPEATRSGYTMAKAMQEVDYSNIVWSEFPLLGYYQNDEYLEAVMEYPRLKKIFVDADFQDIAIAEVDDIVDGCPHHVIVTQLGGYVPPNYTAEQLDSWQKALESLNNVYPGWKRLITSGAFYDKHKTDIDRMIFLLDTRIKNISAILTRMQANQWLTGEEKGFLDKDKEYGEEQQKLSELLNAAN